MKLDDTFGGAYQMKRGRSFPRLMARSNLFLGLTKEMMSFDADIYTFTTWDAILGTAWRVSNMSQAFSGPKFEGPHRHRDLTTKEDGW